MSDKHHQAHEGSSPPGHGPFGESEAISEAGSQRTSWQPRYSRDDFCHSPLLVFYEVTRACDLVCNHCRASAMPHPAPEQLTSQQSADLLEALATFPKRPMVVLTGGDPMKRPDLMDLISHGTQKGLRLAVTPSPTPLMNAAAVAAMKEAGACGFGVSLDGANARTHDSFRGIEGSYELSLSMIRWAGEVGLPVQVNTTVLSENLGELQQIASQLESLPVQMWSVFFLVPVGRARHARRISARQYELVFELLYHESRCRPYAVKSTEAPHYRRFVMQKMHISANSVPEQLYGLSRYAPVGTNDGRGVMFVSHTGEIYPSGFLPLSCGKFPSDSPVDVYQNDPLFLDLRDADKVQGKCGVCEYRAVCGGSRARAYAIYGDPLAPEPDCVYVPPAWQVRDASHKDCSRTRKPK
ncbi:MAG: TIGR04053 family radical SAM/SPASM domain-containing protein [Candidatus Sumerlaeaceae bacterium]|nr:TIGR04053 family radical SAM/SPASM domain-containing protein [Candidatus Sumerlaeaceae bacterium]